MNKAQEELNELVNICNSSLNLLSEEDREQFWFIVNNPDWNKTRADLLIKLFKNQEYRCFKNEKEKLEKTGYKILDFNEENITCCVFHFHDEYQEFNRE